jgi:hypothetical protein
MTDTESRVANAMERVMKRTLIRYKTKPGAADRNAGLVAKVFEELKATKPDGVRYLSLRLDDDTFVHLVETEDGATPRPSLDAFKAGRRLAPCTGLVEGRPAILVFDPGAPSSEPKYFMLLQWDGDKVATIRDFRHAPMSRRALTFWSRPRFDATSPLQPMLCRAVNMAAMNHNRSQT